MLLVALSPLAWWRPGVFFSPLAVAGACALAGYLLAACARVIAVLRRPRDAPLAAQLRLFALGLLGGLTPFVALSLLPLVLLGRVLVSADLTILALALLPLSVGVAILRSEFLGVVSLVHRPTLHSVLRITLLATIMGISGGAVAVAQQYQAWLAPVIAAGVGACLALGFSPVLGWLTRRGERLFLRDTYDTGGILLQISAELAQATPLGAGPLVVTRLTSVLDLSFAALLTDAHEWTCCHPRSVIPDALRSAARQRARAILTQASGAAAVVERVRCVPILFLPVGQDTEMRAVLCLGPKRSGDRYTSQDQALLGVLGRHLAILFSNHRLHGCLAAHITALHAAAEERMVLSDQVRVAAQHERRRLAGALHHEAIQLGEEVIRVLGDLLTAPRLPLETQARLTTAALLSDDLVGCLREVVTELYPPPLETAGLLPAVHALLRDTERRGGYTCALVSDPLITRGRFPQEMEETLYTITREAVGNAVRHAKATRITVALACVGDDLRLTVCDNGQGFTPREVSDLLTSGHLGLALLQERVRALEGTVTLTTAAGQGTTVEVRVPAPVVRPAVEVSV